MSGFLYYLPDRSTVARSELEGLGLGHLLEPRGPGPSVTTSERGPDQHAGVVFSVPGLDGSGGELLATAAAAATWSRIDGSLAWVGFLPAVRPGPDDLARSKGVSGHEVALADGRRWMVPVARCWDGASRFPCKLVRREGRWVEGDVLEPYRKLRDAALLVWDELNQKRRAELDIDTSTSVAIQALATNYRIGPGEVAALELLDAPCMVEVLKALVDWPTVEALGKAQAAEPS